MKTNQDKNPVEIIESKKLINKGIYGILALIFGIFGAHKFYIGKPTLGLVYLTWLPGLIISTISYFLFLRGAEYGIISNNSSVSYYIIYSMAYLFVISLIMLLITAFISINESVVAFLQSIINQFKLNNKFIYAGLAFFLGIFGAHKFYIGKSKLGWIYYILSIPFTIISFTFFIFIAIAGDLGDISIDNPLILLSAYFFLGSLLSSFVIALISIIEAIVSLFR